MRRLRALTRLGARCAIPKAQLCVFLNISGLLWKWYPTLRELEGHGMHLWKTLPCPLLVKGLPLKLLIMLPSAQAEPASCCFRVLHQRLRPWYLGYRGEQASGSRAELVVFWRQICVPGSGQYIFTRVKPCMYTQTILERIPGYSDTSPKSNYLSWGKMIWTLGGLFLTSGKVACSVRLSMRE